MPNTYLPNVQLSLSFRAEREILVSDGQRFLVAQTAPRNDSEKRERVAHWVYLHFVLAGVVPVVRLGAAVILVADRIVIRHTGGIPLEAILDNRG